jgi:hypothetical protein
MDIDKVQAEWVLGLFSARDLPEFAAQAMMQGFEGPFILEMVSFHRPDAMPDRIFDGALREMGRQPIRKPQAALRLAKDPALRLLRNQISPLECAREIDALRRKAGWDDLHEVLWKFHEVVLELEDRSGSESDSWKRIIELAWSLLEEDPSP